MAKPKPGDVVVGHHVGDRTLHAVVCDTIDDGGGRALCDQAMVFPSGLTPGELVTCRSCKRTFRQLQRLMGGD